MTLSVVPSDTAAAGGDTLLEPRFEILPFGSSEQQAADAGRPLRLTVTTSPKHGVDRSLDLAIRLRALGHGVTVHVAARMVKGDAHLEEILARSHEAGIDDLFVIGGDAPEPLGPFDAALPVLERIAAHPLRPARLGVGAYPEGHPLIDRETLDAVLAAKAPLADYLVTQLCFDVQTLLHWLEHGVRARGIELPLYVGAVGPVERRKLLEISTRIGVGPSLRFLRKQRGLATLFRSPADTAVSFYDGIAPQLGRDGIAGIHFFTFNDLLGTLAWADARR